MQDETWENRIQDFEKQYAPQLFEMTDVPSDVCTVSCARKICDLSLAKMFVQMNLPVNQSLSALK